MVVFELCESKFYKQLMTDGLFYEMENQGLLQKVFYGVENCDQEWFRNFMENCWLYFGFENDMMVGAVWFTNFTEDYCNLHFCTLKGCNIDNWTVQFGNLLQNVLDKSGKPWYRIRMETPYKGVTRIARRFGIDEWEKRGDMYCAEVKK